MPPHGPPRTPRALVTGGTGAVGAATCRRLLRAGYRVTFTYRSNRRAAEELVRWAETHDAGEAVAFQADLASPDAGAGAVEVAVATPNEITAASAGTNGVPLAGLALLVHAAGPFVPQKYLSAVTPSELVDQLRQETSAFFNVLVPALPHLRAAGGSLVAVTTVALRRLPMRDGLSPAAKAGIESIVRAIAAEEGKYGVRANCVGPGLLSEGIAADLVQTGEFSDREQDYARSRIPMRRFGTADEVASVAEFLASPAASYVSGQFIDVDGGYSI